jgi:hypothetical protein
VLCLSLKLLIRPGEKLLDIFSQCGVPSVSAELGEDSLACGCDLFKPTPSLGVHPRERARRRSFESSAFAVALEKFGDLGSCAGLLDHHVTIPLTNDDLDVRINMARKDREVARLGPHGLILVRVDLQHLDAAHVGALAGDRELLVELDKGLVHGPELLVHGAKERLVSCGASFALRLSTGFHRTPDRVGVTTDREVLLGTRLSRKLAVHREGHESGRPWLTDYTLLSAAVFTFERQSVDAVDA